VHPYLLRTVYYSWYAVGAFILLGSFNSKRKLFEETFTAQLPRSLVIAVGFGLVFEPRLGFGPLNRHWLNLSVWDQAMSLVLCFAGLGLVVWSRAVLSGNWSADVALKQGHTLIQRGPYRVVRHPLYTGILVALVGTVLANGTLRALLGFVLLAIGLKIKSLSEERLMRHAFGPAYESYCAATGALLPRLR
jgi:protein-S-isoprenylcysteine O-methyltransferase Ste14